MTTALEVLLCSGDSNEITHKLATRLAAIAALVPDGDSKVVTFRNVKRIYNFRSAVVHGEIKKARKTKEIRISETQTIPTVGIATAYLRTALETLLGNPDYLKSENIDEKLLLKGESSD